MRRKLLWINQGWNPSLAKQGDIQLIDDTEGEESKEKVLAKKEASVIRLRFL